VTEDKLRESFPLFLIYVWRFLGLPDPTPVQLDMAKFLQHGGRRIIVEAFRGVGKSWITAAFVCWLLYRNREVKVLVVSASKERSDSFSIFTKRLIWEVPVLQYLKPSRNQGDRVANVAFDVRGCKPSHAPSVKSVGIRGQMTGSRADYVIADDVEVVNNSETAAQREKLLTLVSEMGGAILTPAAQAGTEGGIVFLGTPQVEDSMYTHLPDRGYELQVWPAEVPQSIETYGGCLGPCIVKMLSDGVPAGIPTEPTRFGTIELEERRLEYGAAGYALQFQLDTTLADTDKNPLKLADFIVARTDVDICPDKYVWGRGEDQEMGHIPLVGLTGDRFFRALFAADEWSPYEFSLLYIDPSGRGKDQTGYCVVKYLHGMIVVRKWGGLVGGYDDKTLTKLSTIAKQEKVDKIVIESNFGDGMYARLLQPVLARVSGGGIGIEDDHVTGQKELRICDNLEPALASHRIILDETLLEEATGDRTEARDHEAVLKTPFYQLTRITRERGSLKYDDHIDAFAGAVRWCTSRMSRDVNIEATDRESERVDQMLEDFVNGVSVWKPSQPETISKKNWAQVMRP
jgi:hypothetical protein